MKELLKKISWWVDINLVYLLFNGNKMYRYHQYIERKWGIKPATIRENVLELNSEAVLWDGLDEAIIGISDDNRVVYSLQKIYSELQTLHGWTYEEADKWVAYNISSVYDGEFTPIHIWEF